MLLQPFYEADIAAGRLTDDEASFHVACSLLRDTTYAQLGGPDENGNDVTSRLSYLILDAIDQLRVPANIGVCVGPDVDPGLLQRGVEIQFEHKMGFPKFLGVGSTVQGLIKNGYSVTHARQRAYSGCHWCAVPGREYAMRDIIKINFASLFLIALRETVEAADGTTTVDGLWRRFEYHLKRAIEVTAEGLSFHLEHMHEVFPELVLDLLCHGPLEKGLDASHGGVEIYNIGIDGAALATVADSMAAIEQRVEEEGRISWPELVDYLENDWDGPQGERARLMMKSVAALWGRRFTRRWVGQAHRPDLHPLRSGDIQRRTALDARPLLVGQHAESWAVPWAPRPMAATPAIPSPTAAIPIRASGKTAPPRPWPLPSQACSRAWATARPCSLSLIRVSRAARTIWPRSAA